MIRLRNNHQFEYMVASGALGFDGKGWLWEQPLVWLGLIQPELFTVVMRTVTRQPRLYPVCNLSWIRPWTWLPWSPWSCVRFLKDGGAVNKVGLYNPGIDWWCEKVAPRIDFHRVPLVASIYGDRRELVESAIKFNLFDFVAIEVNDSCPNTGHGMAQVETIVENVREVRNVSRHPIIIKVSVAQDYLAIARMLEGIAEAISLNSVPWNIAFPNGEITPLAKLEKRVSGGGGGVSGKPAQHENWRAVATLAAQRKLPVIGPSVMNYDDVQTVRRYGASAISFGAIHLRTPWKPTTIVRKEMEGKK